MTGYTLFAKEAKKCGLNEELTRDLYDILKL